ncbi:CpaF family protein [Lentibacillus salinarum]|uniref:CpaF family protein n=1 Tax=Lentibacillus salinarum TaxID=446820 RepID=A0ABW3ZY64_9BACI
MNHDLDRIADKVKTRMAETGDDMQNQLFRLARAGDQTSAEGVRHRIWNVVRDERIMASGLSPDVLVQEIFKRNWGLGPIQGVYDEPSVNEVWVNGPGENNVWVERKGQRMKVDVSFPDDDAIREVQQRVLSVENQELNQTNPIVESKMLDGTRVTLTCPPETSQRTITLRKHNTIDMTEDEYIRQGTLDRESSELLKKLVRGRSNTLLIGATSSGKTSMLKWLTQFIRPNLRVGVLEGTYELALDQFLADRNVICFEEQPRLGRTLIKQFHTMLRESPDVIVLGEARGEEADQMIKTFRRGHPGSFGTIHSNSPEAAIQDLADMIMEDGRNWDQKSLYLRVARSIDTIVQLHLEPETGIRRLWRVAEVYCPELAEDVQFNDLIRFDAFKESWDVTPNNASQALHEKLELQGVNLKREGVFA